jgi:hypothetical protein
LVFIGYYGLTGGGVTGVTGAGLTGVAVSLVVEMGFGILVGSEVGWLSICGKGFSV